MMQHVLVRLLAVISCNPGTVLAAESVFRSGPEQVALIELYTSEGCSSCPPAEAWLGKLREDAGLWTRFVPVAFHVNYWDHLGWRDALASQAFTDRQHTYAEAWRAGSVYTPGFVRNGAEWRPRGQAPSNPPEAGRNAGLFTTTWDRVAHRATLAFQPAPAAMTDTRGSSANAFQASVALLGGGIVHPVRKGENAGSTLRHEFVALRLETVRLMRNDAGVWTAEVSLPPRTEIATSRLAIAAWVTRAGQLTPLQAVGGWIE